MDSWATAVWSAVGDQDVLNGFPPNDMLLNLGDLHCKCLC